MIPLNVTHTAIATKTIQDQILGGTASLPKGPASKLRHMLSTLVGFFAESYKEVFGFQDGPPIHDALTIAYVSRPDLFKSTRHRVDVEVSGNHTIGQTVVDIWNYRTCNDSWGPDGKNCMIAQEVDVCHYHLSAQSIADQIVGARLLQLTPRVYSTLRPSVSYKCRVTCYSTCIKLGFCRPRLST